MLQKRLQLQSIRHWFNRAQQPELQLLQEVLILFPLCFTSCTRAKLQEQVIDLRATVLEIRRPLTELEKRVAGAVDPSVRSQLEVARDDLARTLAPTLSPLEIQLANYEQQLSDLKISRNLVQTGGAQVISAARIPSRPFTPNPRTDLVGGAALAVLLAVFAAFLANHLDRRLRSVEEIRRVARWPLMALVPRSRRLFSDGSVLAQSHPSSPPAEGFRSLRTSLLLHSLDHPFRILQVTSASAGDGKSTTVANLAVNLARSGRRVIAIDLDLRRPSLHMQFDLSTATGVTDVLLGEATLAQALQAIPSEPNLSILVAGEIPDDPSEMIGSAAMLGLLDEAAMACDVLLLDTSPVQPVSDPLVVASHVDGVVMVVAVGLTRRDSLVDAIERLRQVNAPILGVVVNRVSEQGRYGYEYGEQRSRWSRVLRRRSPRRGRAHPTADRTDRQATSRSSVQSPPTWDGLVRPDTVSPDRHASAAPAGDMLTPEPTAPAPTTAPAPALQQQTQPELGAPVVAAPTVGSVVVGGAPHDRHENAPTLSVDSDVGWGNGHHHRDDTDGLDTDGLDTNGLDTTLDSADWPFRAPVL